MDGNFEEVAASTPTRSRGQKALIAFVVILGLAALGGLVTKLDEQQRASEMNERLNAAGPARTVTLRIAVDAMKPDGRPWDGLGSRADVAVCIGLGGGVMSCYPGGERVQSVRKPVCEDATSCEVHGVLLPGRGEVEVVVLDVDASAHDTIGSGRCELVDQCTVGAARITVIDHAADARRARDEAARQERADSERRAAEEAARLEFEAMSPSEHVEAARAAMADGYIVSDRVGGRLDDALRHLGAISSEDAEQVVVQALRREVEARRDRMARIEAVASRELMRRQRDEIAARMDRAFLNDGIEVESVEATGPDHTVLRIRYALCGRVFADRVIGSSSNFANLRRAGFVKAECRGLVSTTVYDLR